MFAQVVVRGTAQSSILFRGLWHYHHSSGSRRYFSAVKELAWCAPSDSPNRRRHNKSNNNTDVQGHSDFRKRNNTINDGGENSWTPIDRFGIIAAMSRNRVIGVKGQLPWNLPIDRKHFQDLTRNTVLILGRRTWDEDLTRSHVAHAAAAIVISKTLFDAGIEGAERSSSSSSQAVPFHVARSFSEALHIAREIVEAEVSPTCYGNDIPCWVCGGERIYHEALLHPFACELHLTLVHTEIDVALCNRNNNEIAFFPANYRWDNKFKTIAETKGAGLTHIVYERIPDRGLGKEHVKD